MTKNSKLNLSSPCGIFCEACPKYKENQTCRGCRRDPKHDTCDIYDCCVTLGGKTFCFECDCFPCERLKNFTGYNPGKQFAHYRHIAIENLKNIRDTGFDRWIEEIMKKSKSGEYSINKKDTSGNPDDTPCSCANRFIEK